MELLQTVAIMYNSYEKENVERDGSGKRFMVLF